MNNLSFTDRAPLSGFRLHKLEVYNWGTFNSTSGQVYSVRPAGQSTLLIGQNASGKSTLVDALLTLLVRPAVRNYNVAAGAHKQERDERTYIKGAFGRFSRDEDNRADVQFLRPSGSHYSALLACFRNEASGDVFTLAQVLYLNSEGRVEKVYCFAPEERSIAADFAGMTSMEKVRQQMEKRGFRATTRYTEYHSWFAKATGVRSRAMDMFNQTVAVKDIQSLNRFIRDHMLDAKPWADKVDELLNHFTLLSEAHQSLVRVRRQSHLLQPVVERGASYRELATQLARAQRLLGAADSFFRQQTVVLLTPQCQSWRDDLVSANSRSDDLARQIAAMQEEARRIKNEIDQAGGERLRQIPLLIDKHETAARAKRDTAARYQEALRAAGFTEPVTDEAGFAAVHSRLGQVLADLQERIEDDDRRRVDLAVQRRNVNDKLQEESRELEALSKRQGNLPETLAELRRRLCEDLRLPEKDVPFAAELIAVKSDERQWEASIEMVLRGFALSLLVPQRHHAQVSAYADRTQLIDSRGRGQRLVYLRVGARAASSSGPPPHPRSLLRKLDFRENHSLLPWVKAELEERFDFRCCETIDEFQGVHDLALTRERHLKVRGVRHEKDDRPHASDPRHFVLGWDNREKRRRLAEGIQQRQADLQSLDRQMDALGQELNKRRMQQTAAEQLQQVAEFGSIDFAANEREIEALRREKQILEEQSDTIRMLKQRLAEVDSRQVGLQSARERLIGDIRDLERQIGDGERLVAAAQRQLERRRADGTLEQHSQSFTELEALLHEEPLTAVDLVPREQQLQSELRGGLDRLQAQLDPARSELCAAMNRFLREFPEELNDLEARAEYLDSFLGLAEHIQREDLPRHEQRFKERLNEKVIQEIGLLNGALQSEASEIRSKIDVLNQSLRQLEYRPGTHMRLEPRPVRDPEITEFQNSLKECLAGTFEGTLEADEARYLRIEKLITRLREEQRWREKVTDVRRWFDFAARELDDTTGSERGYYEDSTGQSGGEKAKLAFTILVAAIAYQYDIDPHCPRSNRFHFVVVDEMFSKVDDQYAEFALELFQNFGLQLLIVAPLDAKARVTEPYVGSYLHVVKDARTSESEVFSMTAREFEAVVEMAGTAEGNGQAPLAAIARPLRLPR
jgi:uncharacterized protein YPO0396